jgi:hypothetical protein
MNDAAGEATLFARMRSIDDTERLSYAERGRIALVVRENRLHLHRIHPETGEPCTWTEWCRLCSPWGYSVTFQAVRDIERGAMAPGKRFEL